MTAPVPFAAGRAELAELRLVAALLPPAGPSRPAAPPGLAHAGQARSRTLTRPERFHVTTVGAPSLSPPLSWASLADALQVDRLDPTASSQGQRGPPRRL